MRKIQVEALRNESFMEFGSYANFITPDGQYFYDDCSEFYRDRLVQKLQSDGTVAYSCICIHPRPLIIDATENHYNTGEGIMPLDQDVIMHFGCAAKKPELSNFRAFYIPKGTMVVIKPGVFHMGPFATEDRDAHLLCALPEMTYARDCHVFTFSEKERIEIIK